MANASVGIPMGLLSFFQRLDWRRGRVHLLWIAALLMPARVGWTEQVCVDENPIHIVRSVTVDARWFPESELSLKRGDGYAGEQIAAARMQILAEIRKEKEKNVSELVGQGRLPVVALNYIDACGQKAPAELCQSEGLGNDCVDVVFNPFIVDTDPVNLGSNLLPSLRSNKFRFQTEEPRVLRLLHPKPSVSYDRTLGSIPKVENSSDLLSIPNIVKKDGAKTGKAALTLKASGAKSLTEPFYGSDVALSFSTRQPNSQIEDIGLDANFSADQQPLSDQRYLQNSFRLGGHTTFNPALGLINRVSIGGGGVWSRNRVSATDVLAAISDKDIAIEGRFILEGRVLGGFTRFGLWGDRGKPKTAVQKFTRMATLIGYDREIPIRNHGVGLEILAGTGRSSSATPAYALFFGGNALQNYLYDDINDPSLAGLSGPVARSFGRNQAGISTGTLQSGANAYQHFNLSLSIPIPRLSYPLIPDEVIATSSTGDQLTLRRLIKNGMDEGQDLLSIYFQDQGMETNDADKKAEKVFKEVRPGVTYLADYAQIFAIKPLLMFDQVRLRQAGAAEYQTRYAAGVGLQLTVVVVKFEAGYMRTTRRFNNDPKGAWLARMTFLNIF